MNFAFDVAHQTFIDTVPPGRGLTHGGFAFPVGLGQLIGRLFVHFCGGVGHHGQRGCDDIAVLPGICACGDHKTRALGLGDLIFAEAEHGHSGRGGGFDHVGGRIRACGDKGINLAVLERGHGIRKLNLGQGNLAFETEEIEVFLALAGTEGALAEQHRLAFQIVEAGDPGIGAGHEMHGQGRDREKGADLVKRRVAFAFEHGFAALGQPHQRRRRGEDVIGTARLDLHHVLNGALAFFDSYDDV